MNFVGRAHNCRPSASTAAAVPQEAAEIVTPAPRRAKPQKKRAADPKVADVAAQVQEKVAARREGKKQIAVWLSADHAKLLKMAAAQHDTTQEAIVAEAVADILVGKYS